jgi:hypothetical protein
MITNPVIKSLSSPLQKSSIFHQKMQKIKNFLKKRSSEVSQQIYLPLLTKIGKVNFSMVFLKEFFLSSQQIKMLKKPDLQVNKGV